MSALKPAARLFPSARVDSVSLSWRALRRTAADASGSSSSPPANGGGSAPALSLGSSVGATYENGTDVADDAAIDTQLQQYGTNILAGSDSSATATESSLISLGVSTVETDEDGRRRRRRLKLVSRRRLGEADDGDEPLTIVMQNIKPIDYGGNSEDIFVNVTCPEGFFGVARAICPETNASVGTNCTGRYWNNATQTYDYSWSTQLSCSTKATPSCLLWNADRQNYDSESCKPRNWTATNTTCVCGDGALESGGASFTSGTMALLGSFAAMFDPSAFGPGLFAKNPLLLGTFGVIAGLTLLNGLLGCKHDSEDASEAWTTVEAAKARRGEARDDELGELREAVGVGETDEMRAAIAAQHTVAAYARTSMPEFVEETNLCQTFVRVLSEEHSWISASAWGAYDPIVPRYIRAECLALEMLWLMYAEALLYEFLYPDLGCSLFMTESDCLTMSSPYDPDELACAWTVINAIPCDERPPDPNAT